MTSWDLYSALHLQRLVVIGVACSESSCRELATWMCYWPGQTRPKCERHRVWSARIAEAMGFELQSKPLDVVPDGDPSSVRFQLMEIES